MNSSLGDYSDVNILLKGTITAVGAGATKAARMIGRNTKEAIFKIYASFIDYIRKINNTQIENVKNFDVKWRRIM